MSSGKVICISPFFEEIFGWNVKSNYKAKNGGKYET